jgi:PHD/YefM family antitoxin component YafN of YafNO toxin-antitoxin module
MNTTLIDLTERLVPISDFSQGKAGKIFSDVYENNAEYIVLKNNQPTAVVLSIQEYRNIQNKINNMEKMLEDVENIRLLQLANKRDNSETISFEEIVTKEGYTMDEIKKLSESVEIE